MDLLDPVLAFVRTIPSKKVSWVWYKGRLLTTLSPDAWILTRSIRSHSTQTLPATATEPLKTQKVCR